MKLSFRAPGIQGKAILCGLLLMAGGIALYAGLKEPLPEKDNAVPVPNWVTAEIQEGIEKYIEDEAAKGGGYFKFSSGGKEYLFKLVRVHTEYLARLGKKRHFACVDMVDVSGDVYDIDFFLAGEPGNMTVTETTLHKLNGIPFYTWEQNEEGGWQRVPTEDASPRLLGVIRGEDEFEFRYRVKIPEIGQAARMWIPYPLSDAYQDVELLHMQAPRNFQVLRDEQYQNAAFYFELLPEDRGKTIDIHYHVVRREKSAYESDEDTAPYLLPEKLVPLNANFEQIAQETVQGKTGDLVRARALYDHVIEHMRYMKYGSGWGKGDAVYACNLRTGNCTDFHAYFKTLARSVGIPARFAIGAAIPSERNEGGVDGYHCWVEFYAEGKWWPVDISEADKYSSLSTYYFGHHPANRFEMSRGRDLVFEPGPESGPINFLAYPVYETEGRLMKLATQFSFKRISVRG